MYCSVLTPGVTVMYRVIERVALAGAEGHGVTQRAFDEAGVFSREHSQPGINPA